MSADSTPAPCAADRVRRVLVLFGAQCAYAANFAFAVFAFHAVCALAREFENGWLVLTYPAVMLAWPLRKLWIAD